MSKIRNTYNRQLAEATRSYFVRTGDNFATPDNIHREMYGRQAPSKAIRQDIQKRLSRIKAILNREIGMPVFLVGDYALNAEELPKGMKEARLCVAGIGPGNKAAAIGRVNGVATQMIYQAEKQAIIQRSRSCVKHNANDVVEACGMHRLSASRGNALLEDLRQTPILPAIEDLRKG